jgi:hypothetical protein
MEDRRQTNFGPNEHWQHDIDRAWHKIVSMNRQKSIEKKIYCIFVKVIQCKFKQKETYFKKCQRF